MASYIKKIIDGNGDTIYPQSKASAIFTENDERNLEVALTKRIVVSSATPAEQVTGDLWYKEITEM